MSRLLDPRDRIAALRELAGWARNRSAALPTRPGETWHDLLFDTDDTLSDPTRPDQALLLAVAALGEGIAEHLNELPARLHRQWLEEILRIPAAAAVADRVPLGLTIVPGAGPVTVGVDTEVRAKDAEGRDRRYRTTEPVEVHGAAVPVVRASRARTLDTGGVADLAVEWTDRDVPFDVWRLGPGEPGVVGAGHALRFSDPVLATDGTGTATVRVTVDEGLVTRLAGATWRHSTVDGPMTAVTVGSPTQNGTHTSVKVQLSGPCQPEPGQSLPWLEVTLPPDDAPLDATALAFRFTDVTLRVEVVGLAPQAAFAGDARLDLSKAFEPFGPVPREGDALVVRSDEALGKPLAWFGIDVGRHATSSDATHHPKYLTVAEGKGRSTKKNPMKTSTDTSVAVFVLETWNGVAWGDQGGPTTVAELANIGGGVGSTAGGAASAALTYAGQTGRFARVRLQDGDFGWAAYQTALAQLAATAGGTTGRPTAASLVPPEAPRLERLRVSYTTSEVTPTAVTSYDGFVVRRWTGGAHSAFRTTVALGQHTDAGALDLAVDVPDTAIGGSVSLYLEVEPADIGAAVGISTWQISTTSGWRVAAVADGTRGLRQSGLVRVLAPAAWTRGSDEAGDTAGEHRWLRLSSTEPGRLGSVLAVVPDAVIAAQTPRPILVDPGMALLPDQVKGLVTAVPGIRRVTAVRGLPGRDEEHRADYLHRASGYHRHRDRALAAWDYEELARTAVPGLAAVRCLPHTCQQLGLRPGSVALVVVPSGTGRPMPVPTVAMAELIENALSPRMPLTASLVVLPPAYVAVTVGAHVVLGRGVPSLAGRSAVLAGLEWWLHPAARHRPRFGSSLYASAVATFLESLPEVDHVDRFDLALPDGTPADRVTVDPMRGLVASSGAHTITVEEQL